MSEDQELMARISRLAGQINRHKNNLQPESSQAHGVLRHHPYSRGRAWGPHAFGVGHRNRTVVFNRGDDDATLGPSRNRSPGGAAERSPWVAKHGRHLQLISSAVYEKEAEQRSRSNSRQPDANRSSHDPNEAQGASVSSQLESMVIKPNAPHSHHLEIEGIIFQVCDGGRKLVRTTGSSSLHLHAHDLIVEPDNMPSLPTPEKVLISNVEFLKTETGDLERVGATRTRFVKMLPTPLADLIKTRKNPPSETETLCKRFSNTGQCPRGPRCAHIHDPNKVAICRDFLRQGKCPDGDHCDLSHECSYERVPACSHFQRGKCNKEDCRYAHVRVNPAADVCRAFSTYGYCSKGSLCHERHVFECPDYASTGSCLNKGCRLPHIDRAGKLRQSRGTAKEAESGGTSSRSASAGSPLSNPDENSDEGDEMMEDMIPLGTNIAQDQTLSQQDDFVRL